MIILALGEDMAPLPPERFNREEHSSVVVCQSAEAPEALALTGMAIEGALSGRRDLLQN